MNKIYAICRHYQDGDADSYHQWRGEQILGYHASKTGAQRELNNLLEKEIRIVNTSSDSLQRKEQTRSNQVMIADGTGMNTQYTLQQLYVITELDLKP